MMSDDLDAMDSFNERLGNSYCKSKEHTYIHIGGDMVRDREAKVESSMPLQSRVDLLTVADLVNYWESEGVHIRTMSQLVSWSLEYLRELLEKNGLLGDQVRTLEDAYSQLELRGLLQRSMKERMKKKLAMARGLENVRLDGWEVDRDSRIYKTLHNERSVRPREDRSFLATELESIKKSVEFEIKMEQGREKVRDKGTIWDKYRGEFVSPEEFEVGRQKRVEEERERIARGETVVEEEEMIDNEDGLEKVRRRDRELAEMDMAAPKGK